MIELAQRVMVRLYIYIYIYIYTDVIEQETCRYAVYARLIGLVWFDSFDVSVSTITAVYTVGQRFESTPTNGLQVHSARCCMVVRALVGVDKQQSASKTDQDNLILTVANRFEFMHDYSPIQYWPICIYIVPNIADSSSVHALWLTYTWSTCPISDIIT